MANLDIVSSLFEDYSFLLRETSKRFGCAFRSLLNDSLGKFCNAFCFADFFCLMFVYIRVCFQEKHF